MRWCYRINCKVQRYIVVGSNWVCGYCVNLSLGECWLWKWAIFVVSTFRTVSGGPNFIALLNGRYSTVRFPSYCAASRRHTKRHANLPVLTARKKYNDVTMQIHGKRAIKPPNFLHTRVKYAYTFVLSTKMCLPTVKQRYEIGLTVTESCFSSLVTQWPINCSFGTCLLYLFYLF